MLAFEYTMRISCDSTQADFYIAVLDLFFIGVCILSLFCARCVCCLFGVCAMMHGAALCVRNFACCWQCRMGGADQPRAKTFEALSQKRSGCATCSGWWMWISLAK